MKHVFASIAAHVGAKQLTGVIALLGLALLIPRAMQPSTGVSAPDDFAGFPAASPADPLNASIGEAARTEAIASPAATSVGGQRQNIDPTASRAIGEPAPHTAAVLGYAAARQSVNQESDGAGNVLTSLRTSSTNGSSSQLAGGASFGSSGGAAAANGGGGMAGSGGSATRSEKPDEAIVRLNNDRSENSDANALSSGHVPPVTPGTEQAAAALAALPGAAGETPAAALLALPDPGMDNHGILADGSAGNSAAGGADLNLNPAEDPTRKAEALTVDVKVPDSGSTILLLAGAMIGLLPMRRRSR